MQVPVAEDQLHSPMAEDQLHIVVAGLELDEAGNIADQISRCLPSACLDVLDLSRSRHSPLQNECSALPVDLVVLVLPKTFRATGGGSGALGQLLGQFADIGPVLVILEKLDNTLGLALLQAGAEDWVPRESFDPRSLIHRVIWRHRAHLDTWNQDLVSHLDGETERLDGIIAPGSTPITARTYTHGSVRNALPDLFETLLQRLNTLVDQSVEDRIYGTTHPVDADLVTLAESLGFVRAGPRDVIDLYVTIIRSRSAEISAKRRAVLMEEMRLLVLQLMGHLANHYRLRVVGAPLRKGDRG